MKEKVTKNMIQKEAIMIIVILMVTQELVILNSLAIPKGSKVETKTKIRIHNVKDLSLLHRLNANQIWLITVFETPLDIGSNSNLVKINKMNSKLENL